MTALRQHVVGVNIRTKEDALAYFWALHRKLNGARRQDPEEFVEILRVVKSERGSWDVYYRVPSRVVREAHERRV